MELEILKYELMSEKLKSDINLSKCQQDAFNLMTAGENVFVTGLSGAGKCLAKDTSVIMYSGEIKMIQDIKKGEQVMGDDSTPRNVLSTTSGVDWMYTVHTSNGDSYTVNSHHILTFQTTKTIKYRKNSDTYVLHWGDESGIVKSKHFKHIEDAEEYGKKYPVLIDIPIMECIEKNKKREWRQYFQGLYKGITFSLKKVYLDPYILGTWLADDTTLLPQITTTYNEIADYLMEYCNKNNLELHQVNTTKINKCSNITRWQKDNKMFQTKFA